MTIQHCWLDAALVGVMIIGIVGTLIHRIKLEFGIGDRAIQLVGLCLIVPAILILSLEGKFSDCELGTILGTVVGYALSGIGGRDKKAKSRKEEEEKKEKAKNSN
jgi:uncharacterized membrane protein YqgA involved in biofilm formation